MKENFDKCLEMILHHEGGYVNHPDDPGGETNLGVTKRVYEEWGGTKDMKDLTVDDVAPIYKKNYWDRVKGDELPSGLDLCVFDFGVNAGTGRAAKYLQSLVEGLAYTIDKYQEERQKYYESLKHFATFGKGWTRRVNETTELAHSMT